MGRRKAGIHHIRDGITMTLLIAPTRLRPEDVPSPAWHQDWPPLVQCTCARRLHADGIHTETCPVITQWARTDAAIARAAARLGGPR